MRVPLDEDGRIDEAAIAERPNRATVRRFWPNEPDQSGYLLRTPRGWAFSYALGEDDDEGIYHLEGHPLRDGDYVTVTETNGQQLPFRVVQSKPDGVEGA